MKKADVVTYFGSQTKLSKVLGIASSSISQWGVVIPEKQALRLDRLTNGELKYESSLYKKSA